MLLVSKVLAPLIAMNQRVDIGYDHWPGKPLPVCLAHKCLCTYIASSDS
jgi:hypothetical protein